MTQTPHMTDCHHCQRTYDVWKARWCDCVSSSRNLACPHCGRCLCDARNDVIQQFWVSVPDELWRGRTPIDPAQSPVPTTPAIIRPLILVVDDDEDVLAIAEGVINSLGYGVASATPERAFMTAQALRPDLVLTDALMPRVDGRELCLKIKSTPALRGTAVVIMSAVYTASRYRSEAMHVFKADDMVSKPLETRELQRVIESSLNRSGAKRQAKPDATAR